MRKITLLFSILLLSLSSITQVNVDSLFSKTNEVYFSLEINSPKDIHLLTKIISIDNRNESILHAYANKEKFEQFIELGFNFEILPHPGSLIIPEMSDFNSLKAVEDWDTYPTYEAYVLMMEQFETDYPDLCEVFSIGESVDGRELLVAKISDNVDTDEAEPEFLYTSSMHGDEITAYVLMLRLIDSLLTSYESSDRITNLIDNMEIYINPLANPDGTYQNDNSTVNGALRENSNDVDLNRNYPDPKGGPHPDLEAWQDETIAFMDFAEERDFVMACNFHGGTEVCNYPWDTWSDPTADEVWWQFVCQEYADTAQEFSPSTYLDGFIDGITNGYDWYEVEGGRQDYMNYFHQCREFTMEISNVKLVSGSLLPDHWEYNKRSFLNYMEQCLYGIHGVITDETTGLPMVAEVFILSHDEDSSWVYSSLPMGNYHRPIYAGTYDVQFSAPGYVTQVFEDVVVSNYDTTIINVELEPLVVWADFTGVPNPVVVGNSVMFTDNSIVDATSWNWTFDGGIPATTTGKGPHIVTYNTLGSYLVTLEVSNSAGTDIKDDYFIDVINCLHCEASGGGYEYISGIQLGDINNTGTPSSGYFDYSSLSTSLNLSETYLITVTNGSVYSSDDLGVWIDWNQDCDFDDAGENVICEVNNGGQGTFDFSVPGTAILGETVMRIRIKDTGSDCGSPCLTTSYGEVEDYTVVIQTNDLPPLANFSADQLTPFESQTVTFSDLSTNLPTDWLWSFSPSTVTFVGGTNASSQNPQVQFNSLGLYTVTLTATNSFGSDDEEKIDYINVVEQGICDYCETSFDNIDDEWISNVTFHTINNDSESTNYSDFTSMSTNVVFGSIYNLSVDITVDGSYPEHCIVFIDWNQDCDFDDNGENFDLGSVSGSGTLSDDIEVPMDALIGTTRMRVSLRWSTDPDGCDNTTYGEAEDYTLMITNPVYYLDLSVVLEGPYNGTDMNIDLRNLDYIPETQPYNDAPWGYAGIESVESIPSNVVDWVLVEFYDVMDAASISEANKIDEQVGFLKNDGSIVDLDGLNDLQLEHLVIQGLFVNIRHRNHLDVLSANPLSLVDDTYSYDFTIASEQAYGTDAQKNLGGEKYGMVAGDSNADGLIDSNDGIESWYLETGESGYLGSDVNLNGQSNNQDKNEFWLLNKMK